MTDNSHNHRHAGGWLSISPILVFLLVYLATSLAIGDFYKMPISIALLIASVWGAFLLKGRTVQERIEVFSKGAASSTVMYMVWIFILAGIFAAIAKHTGAVEATVNMTVSSLPPSLIVPGLFIAACFISLAIGTSVGTVVALTPLGVEMANATGSSVAFYVAIILGGAFFGDNLSFISDTTIAATRTQGCNMKDKFKANIWICLPAALIALCIYVFLSPEPAQVALGSSRPLWLVVPYLLVIVLALTGMNVAAVLLLGILSALVAGCIEGSTVMDMCTVAGAGIDSVSSLVIITLLAAGMLGLISEAGGIEYLMEVLSRNIHSRRGAQFSISALVAIINLCTANNTVAIITAGKISKRISTQYGITPRKSASLLDTASCVVQAFIPYGAQTLMATSLAGISPVAPWLYLAYPQALLLCLVVSILFTGKRGVTLGRTRS